MKFRLATYNVENLFGRAKVLNFASFETGDDKLKKIGELQSILEKANYSAADRTKAGDLYNELYDVIGYNILRSDFGYYLFRKHNGSYRLVPERSSQWQGFLTFDRDRFSGDTSRHTARVIKEVDADVLCINEVESRPVLDDFNADLLGDLYDYNILIDCKTDRRGIDVGVYSKHPIGEVRTNIFNKGSNKKGIFSRDCLEVEILTKKGPIYVLANHLKSKSGGGDKRRKEQAEEVRRILKTRYNLKKQRVAVLGDLNDTPNSAPLSPLMKMARLTDVLADAKGPPKDRRWTYRYKNQFNQIDYILVSKPLAGELKAAGIERRGMAPEDLAGSNAGVTSFQGIKSWHNAASDHAAVFADFVLK